ncbi:MAG: 4Fe-4S dicluster domain-containing protein [Bacteroidales bacterium]|nr:4Fe-4S dicluster domain-containing protein [Bacteroidales bacterium]
MSNKFGFDISPSRTIDFDKFDNQILQYVLQHESSFMTCMSCGGCTATCSAGNLIDFNIRKMSLGLRRGKPESLAAEIDKCMLCGKCILVCPRGINIRNVVMLIKKALVKFNPKNDERNN